MHEDKKSASPVKSNGSGKPIAGLTGAKVTSRFKKQGGWADETQSQPNKALSALEKRFSSIKLKKQESEEEIPVTAASSDSNNEDIDDLNTVSISKIENHNRAAAYKELNANSISKQNMAQDLDGVDLRILTKNILSESQLKEVDVPWNWDVLFAEMVPELFLDKDKSY